MSGSDADEESGNDEDEDGDSAYSDSGKDDDEADGDGDIVTIVSSTSAGDNFTADNDVHNDGLDPKPESKHLQVLTRTVRHYFHQHARVKRRRMPCFILNMFSTYSQTEKEVILKRRERRRENDVTGGIRCLYGDNLVGWL